MRPILASSITRTTVLAGAVLLLAACGGDDSSGANPLAPTDETGPAAVSIERSRYAPEEIEVTTGSELTFENLDPVAHTVTSARDSSLAFDSGDLGEGDTFVQRFDEAGEYDYFCEIHPTMRATVVVG